MFPYKGNNFNNSPQKFSEAFDNQLPSLHRRPEKCVTMLTLLPKKVLKTKRNIFKTLHKK